MSVSLTDRINNINKRHSKTAYAGSGYINAILGSLAKAQVDLNDTKYSAALAYVFIEPVRVCVDMYAQAFDTMARHIVYNETHDPRNDTIVASSEDVGKPRLPVIAAFRQHRKDYGIGFFAALAYEALLFDSVAVEMLYPDNPLLADMARRMGRISGVKVLRGIGLSLDAYGGEIRRFYYSDDSGLSTTLDPSDVAYDKGYNPFNDYYGTSIVYSILDELNILNQMRRYLQRFLVKADRPDVYGTLKDDTYGNDDEVLDDLRTELRRYAQSQTTLFVGNVPMDFTAVPTGQANTQMDVDDKTRAAIYRAFGVPMALAGDNQATTYQEGQNAYANWIRIKVKPLFQNVQDFVSDTLLSKFGLTEFHRFLFDLSQYDFVTDTDILRIDAANKELEGGKITLKMWAEKTGNDYDKAKGEWRQIEGVLVPPEALDVLWKYKFQVPATEQLAQSQLLEVQAEQMAQPQVPTQTATPLALPAGAPSSGDDDSSDSSRDGNSDIVVDDTKEATPLPIIESTKTIAIDHQHHAHIKAFEPAHEGPDAELKAWKHVAFKTKRTFEPHWLHGDIGWTLQSALDNADGEKAQVIKAFEVAQSQIDTYFKRLAATKVDFEEDFASLMRNALADNNFGRVQWASATRRIIRQYGTAAYVDGLVEGGVFDASPDSLSERDKDNIASLYADASGYVSDLGAKIFKEDAVSEDMALQKPDMWFNRTIKAFYEAAVLEADANGNYVFTGPDGDESCDTCTSLKKQVHRLSAWARRALRPGIDGDNFDCGGFQCEHFLQKVFAAASGNWI